jgi:hypothetical protein
MQYGLIDNGYMKVGPRDYIRVFFEDYLNLRGIDFDLPGSYDSIEPIVINDTIRIAPVEDPIIPEFDTPTQQLAGPFWNSNENPVTGWYDVAPVDLDIAKNKLKTLLAAKRYEKETSDIDITVEGQTVSVSKKRGELRNIWINILTTMGDSDTKNYKFSNGTWITLTKSDVKSIADDIDQSVQAAFDWELSFINRIDAATTASQIQELKTEIQQG